MKVKVSVELGDDGRYAIYPHVANPMLVTGDSLEEVFDKAKAQLRARRPVDAPAPAALPEGYEIIRELTGPRPIPNSRVHLARHVQTGTLVALKTPVCPNASFHHEMAVNEHVRRHDVPGIARCVETGLGRSVQYVATEFVGGRDLGALLRQNPDWVRRDALRITLSVCDTLVRLHQIACRHRDITPDNLLIADDGRIVLTDFGLCLAFVPEVMHQTEPVLRRHLYDGNRLTLATMRDVRMVCDLLHELTTTHKWYRNVVESVVLGVMPPGPCLRRPHADAATRRRRLDTVVLRTLLYRRPISVAQLRETLTACNDGPSTARTSRRASHGDSTTADLPFIGPTPPTPPAWSALWDGDPRTARVAFERALSRPLRAENTTSLHGLVLAAALSGDVDASVEAAGELDRDTGAAAADAAGVAYAIRDAFREAAFVAYKDDRDPRRPGARGPAIRALLAAAAASRRLEHLIAAEHSLDPTLSSVLGLEEVRAGSVERGRRRLQDAVDAATPDEWSAWAIAEAAGQAAWSMLGVGRCDDAERLASAALALHPLSLRGATALAAAAPRRVTSEVMSAVTAATPRDATSATLIAAAQARSRGVSRLAR